MNTNISNLITNIPKPIKVLIPIAILVVAFGLYRPILLESTPPILELSGIEDGEKYKGEAVLVIAVSDQRPGLGSLTVQIDDNPPQPLGLVTNDGSHTSPHTFWTLDTATLTDGEHRISVVATDKSLRKNSTQQQLEFLVDTTPPKLQVPAQSRHVGQGRTLAIFVQTDEPVSEVTGTIFKGTNFNRAITFYPIGSNTLYRGLVGIAVRHPPKNYPLTLKATDLLGNIAEQTLEIQVLKTEFQRGGYIILSPAKQKLMMDKSKSREDNEKRGIAYTLANKEAAQFWEGKSIRPAEGRLTSPFGKYREYNTGVRKPHYGTDIASNVGTPVHAANHGIVTLAESLHLYGKSVVINHGQGVSTSYSHLSELRVEPGDRVKKGQLVGLMGATGQTTGPHLHWGMVVNGVAVAPEEWIENDFSSVQEGQTTD